MSLYITGGTVDGSAASLVTFGLLDDDGSITTPTGKDIVHAIVLTAMANPQMFGITLGGGVWPADAPRDTPVPYITVHQISSFKHRNSGRHYFPDRFLQASIFADSYRDLLVIGKNWESLFDEDVKLQVEDETFGRIWSEELIYVGEDKYQGRTMHHGYIEMRAVSTRKRS